MKGAAKRSCRLAALCAMTGVVIAAQGAVASDSGNGRAEDFTQDLPTIEKGRTLFAQQCASCHALAHEGIGPPLGGITTLLTKAQLIDRVRDPARLVAAGDARATALLRRYKVVMPPFAHLKDDECEAILAFIERESATQNLTAVTVDTTAPPVEVPRLAPSVVNSGLVIELEDVVQIPRLPGRTPYKGITLLRADTRDDHALFVVELMGIVYRVRNRDVAVFLDVRSVFKDFICEPGVATGLGSLALHPEFSANGIFYTTHAESRGEKPVINASDIPPDVPAGVTPPIEWVLTEWRLADRVATTFAGTHREVLRFATPTTAHGSQEIAFSPATDRSDPDYGMLYLTCGDGGSINLKRPDMAGHPRTLLGAILRIDPADRSAAAGSYGIPSDNPFAASEDPAIRQEIWAYGFRNPHRVSWDLSQGKRRMLAVDIGEANIEEVNLIEPGGAYGWGVGALEGTTRIDVTKDVKIVVPATEAELAPFRPPLAQYDHHDGPAITGGYVYTGPIDVLRGKYVFGDIVNGRLFFLNIDAGLTDRTIYELGIVRDGQVATIKSLAHAERAHLRLGYDERTGDLFVLTKDDGMIRRVTTAYRRE